MPWLETPEHGWIAGTVSEAAGLKADYATVKVKRAGFGWFRRSRTVRTDGNGYFGLTKLKPGRYRVDLGGKNPRRLDVRVAAGKVARADF